MSGRIFINYRRGDGQAAAGRLYDRLLTHFDRSELFMDVDAIEPGVDFVKSLDEQVSNCVAFISVIGPDWLRTRDAEGSLRLENPADYVRIEIESALKRDIRVIPVLVDGATMPKMSDLPASLQPFARRNAVEIAHHRFAADCDDLARGIRRALGIASEPQPAMTAQPVVNAAPTAARQLSWAEVFFSFRGRISRRRYFIAAFFILAILLATYVAFRVSGTDVFAGEDQKWELFEKRFVLMQAILVWWPTWALILKRLHDLGHGWIALAPFASLDIIAEVLNVFEYSDLSTQLTLIYLGACLMLGVAKGTDGPNRFGPDPLANSRPVESAPHA